MTTLKDQYGHEYTVPGPWKSLSEVRAANKECGRYWFSRDTMQFFGTMFPEGDKIHAGRFFLTSEQPPNGPRRWSVRVAHDDGSIADLVEGQVANLAERTTLKGEAVRILDAALHQAEVKDAGATAKYHAAENEKAITDILRYFGLPESVTVKVKPGRSDARIELDAISASALRNVLGIMYAEDAVT